MANDFLKGLSGLSGLMKGFSGLMPQDDPNVKLMNAQNEVNDLKDQESAVYMEIGKLAYEKNPGAFPDQSNNLQLIQSNLAAAQAKLNDLQQAKQAAEQAAKEAEQQSLCPNCGTRNPEGVKFCQECGAKLGAPQKVFCTNCGQQNAPGTKFCGGCGNKLDG
jgi:ribosomal protein L40E